jgi:hypothetical protein
MSEIPHCSGDPDKPGLSYDQLLKMQHMIDTPHHIYVGMFAFVLQCIAEGQFIYMYYANDPFARLISTADLLKQDGIQPCFNCPFNPKNNGKESSSSTPSSISE